MDFGRDSYGNGEEEDESHVPIISKDYVGEMRTWHINKANDFTFHYIKFLGQEMKLRCKESFGQLRMSDVMKTRRTRSARSV